MSQSRFLIANNSNTSSITAEHRDLLDNIELINGKIHFSDVKITNSLEVEGTNTVLNSTSVELDDSIIIVGSGALNEIGGLSIEHNAKYSGLLRKTDDSFVLTKNTVLQDDLLPLNSLSVSDLSTENHSSVDSALTTALAGGGSGEVNNGVNHIQTSLSDLVVPIYDGMDGTNLEFRQLHTSSTRLECLYSSIGRYINLDVVMNDSGVSNQDLWSASKISLELAKKHHVGDEWTTMDNQWRSQSGQPTLFVDGLISSTDIVVGDVFRFVGTTQEYTVSTNLGFLQNVEITPNAVSNSPTYPLYAAIERKTYGLINDSSTALTSAWSSTKISAEILTAVGDKDYSQVNRVVDGVARLLSDEVNTGFVQTPAFDTVVAEAVVKDLAGVVTTLGSVSGAFTVGNILYTQGLTVFSAIDFSDPVNPVLLHSISHGAGQNFNRCKQYGAYAMLYGSLYTNAGVGLGLKIINISSPAAMTVVHVGLATDLNIVDFVGSGRYLYIASVDSGSGLGNINLTTFEFRGNSVVQLSNILVSHGLGTRTDSIVIEGNYLYVPSAESPSKIGIVDISDASTPFLASTFLASTQIADMTSQNGILYYTATTQMGRISVLNPSVPVEITCTTESTVRPLRSCVQIEVYGDYLFAVEDGYDTSPQSYGLYMYNSSSLVQIQRLQSTVRAKVLFILGNYLGVVNFSGNVFLQKLNAQGFDFQDSMGITAGKLAVKTEISTNSLNCLGNAQIGGGLFTLGDSIFTGDLVMTDGFVRGCVETNCIVGLGSTDTTINTGGTLVITAPLTTISGNLTVNGTQTIINTEELDVEDTMILLGSSNPADALNLGVLFQSFNTADKYDGFVRSRLDKAFYLIKDASVKPTALVDISTLAKADLMLGGLNSSALTVNSIVQDVGKDCYANITHYQAANTNITGDSVVVAVAGVKSNALGITTNIVIGLPITFVILTNGVYELTYHVNATCAIDDVIVTMGFIKNGNMTGDLWYESSVIGRKMRAGFMENSYHSFSLIRTLEATDIIHPRIGIVGVGGLDLKNYSFTLKRLRTSS